MIIKLNIFIIIIFLQANKANNNNIHLESPKPSGGSRRRRVEDITEIYYIHSYVSNK